MNLLDVFDDVVRTDGDVEAFVETNRRITFGELATEADGVARALLDRGIRAGDVVAIALPSGIDFAVAYHGIVRAGAIATGINPRLGQTDVAHITARCRPALVIDGPLPTTDHADPFARHADPAETDPVAIVWTGGTTGMPKGAWFDHACLRAMADGAPPLSQPGDRRLSPLPFAHVGFMTRSWNELANRVTTIVTPTPWTAAAALDLIERQRVTVCEGVPTQYRTSYGRSSAATLPTTRRPTSLSWSTSFRSLRSAKSTGAPSSFVRGKKRRAGRVPYTRALLLALNDALEARLRHVETKPSLDHDAIDVAIERIRRPELVRDEIGAALLYAQRVEAEVGGLSIETLLPHASNDYVGRFLHVWVPDEQGHGDAQARLARHLGLEPYEPRPEDAVPIHNRIAGVLARILPRVKGMVELTYHAIGAINERLAFEAYRRMAVILERMGEHEMSDTLMRPMRNDEAAHLAYYRTYAKQLRPSLKSWQMAAVRMLIVNTYAPVGAGEKRDKAPLGRALDVLEHDPDDPGIATTVQTIAEELLADGEPLRPFVRNSLLECVRLAREAAA